MTHRTRCEHHLPPKHARSNAAQCRRIRRNARPRCGARSPRASRGRLGHPSPEVRQGLAAGAGRGDSHGADRPDRAPRRLHRAVRARAVRGARPVRCGRRQQRWPGARGAIRPAQGARDRWATHWVDAWGPGSRRHDPATGAGRLRKRGRRGGPLRPFACAPGRARAGWPAAGEPGLADRQAGAATLLVGPGRDRRRGPCVRSCASSTIGPYSGRERPRVQRGG
jgi:hypothetical protein